MATKRWTLESKHGTCVTVHIEGRAYGLTINGQPQKALVNGSDLLCTLNTNQVTIPADLRAHVEGHLRVRSPRRWRSWSTKYHNMAVEIVEQASHVGVVYSVYVNNGKEILMEQEEVVAFCHAIEIPCPAELRVL